MRRIARESRRREQEQRATMLASQLVFDSLPQPLLLLDDARRVLRVNAFARELIGMDPVAATCQPRFATRACWPPPTRRCAPRSSAP